MALTDSLSLPQLFFRGQNAQSSRLLRVTVAHPSLVAKVSRALLLDTFEAKHQVSAIRAGRCPCLVRAPCPRVAASRVRREAVWPHQLRKQCRLPNGALTGVAGKFALVVYQSVDSMSSFFLFALLSCVQRFMVDSGLVGGGWAELRPSSYRLVESVAPSRNGTELMLPSSQEM